MSVGLDLFIKFSYHFTGEERSGCLFIKLILLLYVGFFLCYYACLSPPVKYFSDSFKAVLLLWIFYVFSVYCLLCLCARLFICALW